MTWAEKRKLFYILLLLIFIFGFAYFIYSKYFSVAPTCFDGRKNGDELGVDCGGSCALYCPFQVTSPKVLWVRAFPISQNISHVVASIEHNNITSAARKVSYTIRLYGENNEVVIERKGNTFIGTVGKSAILETLIPTNGENITRVTLNFDEPISWTKIPLALSQIVVNAERFFLEEYSYGIQNQRGTRLSSTIKNESLYSFSNFEAIAILYDRAGNAITTSKIIVPSIEAKGTREVVFTWPFSVQSRVERIEVIPRINPFEAKYD